MEIDSASFDLDSALTNWISTNCASDELTPGDIKEIREHMTYTINMLIDEKGLNEEEALAVAKVRFGGKDVWAEEMQAVNDKNFQLKKIIILFIGVFGFVLGNYLVLCLDKILFLFLHYLGKNEDVILNNTKAFINFVYFLLIMFFIAAFYIHKPAFALLQKINFSMLTTIIFILLVFGSVIAEWYLVTKVNGATQDYGLRGNFFRTERNFKDLSLLICGIGYIFLFFRYRKVMK